MIIAQVCLRLATKEGQSKMCSITVLGGGSENQSVSGVTTICLTQCNTSPSHRVDQIVDCGLWDIGTHLFNGCVKVLDIGRNWNTLSYTPIQSIPNMLNGWHVRWVRWQYKNWDVFQELCIDPCSMGPCIIMLQHELMVVDEWRNNGPQDLVTVSLCIQNAINKMHLCLLSITYACPYHNPTATIGHSIHNVDISNNGLRRSWRWRCLLWRSWAGVVTHGLPCIVVSLRHTCAIIMLSNQHIDMPHLWGGRIISAKEKCSLTQI